MKKRTHKLFGMLMGVLMVGITTSAHAQICPTETAKLLASDGVADGLFGVSVSISGNTAVIGMRYDDDNGNNSGSAYVFEKVDGVWTQQAKFLASDGAADDYFGFSVSINGNTAVIGAPWNADNGTGSGSAYVFEKVSGVWTQQAKLLAFHGAAHDYFGLSVSIDGDTAMIGVSGDDDNGTGSGSVYVFTRSGGVWTWQAKLLPADGTVNDKFGVSVHLSGDTAVIGAYGDDDNGGWSGSAYVFEKMGGVWTQQAKLLASDGAVEDRFGGSVSISGDTAVIGAYWNDDNGLDSGSAYVFEKVGGVWTQQAKLLASDGVANGLFGYSISISGDTAVIGAHRNGENGIDSGSAYVFEKVRGVWTQQAKLLASDGTVDDWFGWSVSISGDTVVIGVPGDDDNGSNSGSAYIFNLGCSAPCPADFTGDGNLDIFDFFAFLDAYNAADPVADLTGDGALNIFDVFAFLDMYNMGCP